MNERIQLLWRQAVLNNTKTPMNFQDAADEFAQLIVKECIGILQTEIELVEGYKSTAVNEFDVRWHEGKIVHFIRLVEKSKKHFGVEA